MLLADNLEGNCVMRLVLRSWRVLNSINTSLSISKVIFIGAKKAENYTAQQRDVDFHLRSLETPFVFIFLSKFFVTVYKKVP